VVKNDFSSTKKTWKSGKIATNHSSAVLRIFQCYTGSMEGNFEELADQTGVFACVEVFALVRKDSAFETT
jgi:hypothetical protein